MSFAADKSTVVEHLATVTPEQWRAFFAAFDRAQTVGPGQMRGGEAIEMDGRSVITMPYFSMADEWIGWTSAFYNENVHCAVNWTSWHAEKGENWIPSDAPEAVMALVLYVRRSRFVEGSLAVDIRSGRVLHAMTLLRATYGSIARGG